MALTRGDVNATLKDLSVIAEDTVIQVRPNLVPLIANTGPEEGAYTKVPVPANLPFPAAFEAERQGHGKLVNVIQTYNQQTYELTIDLDSDLVRNAKAYDYESLVREATMSAVTFPDYLASSAVIAGASTKGYDGVNFYGTTHKFAAMAGAPAIDNTVSKTGQTVVALGNDLASALTKIKTFQDNQKRLLNRTARYGMNELLIHCPVALEQAFRNLLNASWVPVTAPVTTSGTIAVPNGFNNLQGIANIFPDGYLDGTSATTWYLHYVGMPQRPFIYRENYPVQVQVLGFGSEHEINTNSVRIALKQRFSLGYHRFDRSAKIA